MPSGFFSRLFRRQDPAVARLYDHLVAAARQDALYAHLGVPDTLMGRFDALCLHAFLIVSTMTSRAQPLPEMARDLSGLFFSETERGLRQAGVGDPRIPKTVQKFAGLFYGRADAYAAALNAFDETGSRDLLNEALQRNLSEAEGEALDRLVDYVLDARAAIGNTDDASILKGEVSFPVPRPDGAIAGGDQ